MRIKYITIIQTFYKKLCVINNLITRLSKLVCNLFIKKPCWKCLFNNINLWITLVFIKCCLAFKINLLHLSQLSSLSCWGQVIIIQKYYRRWLAVQFVNKLKEDKRRRLEWERQQELSKQKEKEDRIRLQFEKRMHPRSKEDFDLLYNALESESILDL